MGAIKCFFLKRGNRLHIYSVESDGVIAIELKTVDISSLKASNERHYIKKHFWDSAGKQLNM